MSAIHSLVSLHRVQEALRTEWSKCAKREANSLCRAYLHEAIRALVQRRFFLRACFSRDLGPWTDNASAPTNRAPQRGFVIDGCQCIDLASATNAVPWSAKVLVRHNEIFENTHSLFGPAPEANQHPLEHIGQEHWWKDQHHSYSDSERAGGIWFPSSHDWALLLELAHESDSTAWLAYLSCDNRSPQVTDGDICLQLDVRFYN